MNETIGSKGGHNDRISDAIAWCTVKDDDVVFLAERFDEVGIFLGAEELRWVWRESTTRNYAEALDATFLDVFSAVGNTVGQEVR